MLQANEATSKEHHTSFFWRRKLKGRRNVSLGIVSGKQQRSEVVRISPEAALFTTDKYLLSLVTPRSLLTHDFEWQRAIFVDTIVGNNNWHKAVTKGL